VSTDRELLELAAKAADWYCPAPDALAIPKDVPVSFTLFGKNWNPLTDDGDALRLAVKLDFDIERRDGETCVWSEDGYHTERDGDDKFAATRRAIVRAAAEIGRYMP
jgi:hypothetical protein